MSDSTKRLKNPVSWEQVRKVQSLRFGTPFWLANVKIIIVRFHVIVSV
jgi:hypothetical protein